VHVGQEFAGQCILASREERSKALDTTLLLQSVSTKESATDFEMERREEGRLETNFENRSNDFDMRYKGWLDTKGRVGDTRTLCHL